MVISAAPAYGITVQAGSDALFFDMMVAGAPSEIVRKKQESKQDSLDTDNDFDGKAYKDWAAKQLDSSKVVKIPLVSLDKLNNKQELSIPLGKLIEFQITEKINTICTTDSKDDYLKLEKKDKNKNIVSYFYNTIKSGTTSFYIDCIDNDTKKIDSKIIFMTVR